MMTAIIPKGTRVAVEDGTRLTLAEDTQVQTVGWNDEKQYWVCAIVGGSDFKRVLIDRKQMEEFEQVLD